MLALAAVFLLLVVLAVAAQARPTQVQPVAAPQSLLRARQACPNGASPVTCRAALRRAYAGLEWQQKQQLALARQLVGNVTDWTCIHGREGSWTDTADPYWGGLQMDRTFMRTYGADMIRRHHGGLANTWTPREQIIVAQRAFAQGRGYNPWPVTGRACGVIS